MADASTVAGIVGIATAVNLIGTVQKSGPERAFPVVFSSVALFGAIAAVGQFVDWNMATTLAVLFLLGTFLTKGAPVIEWFNKLLGGLNG